MLEEQKLKAEQLYIKYRHLMCHVAMEILQNSADAEDAVQQAFLYLMLHFWEGYTTDEIAGMLHMKTDAVQKAIWRAKKKLATALAES